MFRIVLVSVLAVASLSHAASGYNLFRSGDFPLGRTGDLTQMCQWFCLDTDYRDIFFRTMDNIMHPRIFCGICTRKLTTTANPASVASTSDTPTTNADTPTPEIPVVVPIAMSTIPPPAEPVATEPAPASTSIDEVPVVAPDTP